MLSKHSGSPYIIIRPGTLYSECSKWITLIKSINVSPKGIRMLVELLHSTVSVYEEHAEHSVQLLSDASCQWRNAGCSLNWEMGQVEQTMSALWFSSHCCQTNDGLIDMGFWKMIHIFLDWGCKSGGSLYRYTPC